MKLSQEARERFILDYIKYWREENGRTNYEGAVQMLKEVERDLKDEFNDDKKNLSINGDGLVIRPEIGEKITLIHPTGGKCVYTASAVGFVHVYDNCICMEKSKKPNVYLSDEDKEDTLTILKDALMRNLVTHCFWTRMQAKLS